MENSVSETSLLYFLLLRKYISSKIVALLKISLLTSYARSVKFTGYKHLQRK